MHALIWKTHPLLDMFEPLAPLSPPYPGLTVPNLASVTVHHLQKVVFLDHSAQGILLDYLPYHYFNLYTTNIFLYTAETTNTTWEKTILLLTPYTHYTT